MVFEIFDNHPQNNRALFGGGRYNGLANIFGSEAIPAIGFAPGDETTKLFLESWGLIPDYLQKNPALFIPLLDESLRTRCNKLAHELRRAGFIVELGLEKQNFKQAFKYADRKGVQTVLILGTREAQNHELAVKFLLSGEQETVSQEKLIPFLRQHEEAQA
jgi:histidyl-tRNA synthetase